ncbi:unnamed protein product, partial [Protopolystoma xenopodis]
ENTQADQSQLQTGNDSLYQATSAISTTSSSTEPIISDSNTTRLDLSPIRPIWSDEGIHEIPVPLNHSAENTDVPASSIPTDSEILTQDSTQCGPDEAEQMSTVNSLVESMVASLVASVDPSNLKENAIEAPTRRTQSRRMAAVRASQAIVMARLQLAALPVSSTNSESSSATAEPLASCPPGESVRRRSLAANMPVSHEENSPSRVRQWQVSIPRQFGPHFHHYRRHRNQRHHSRHSHHHHCRHARRRQVDEDPDYRAPPMRLPPAGPSMVTTTTASLDRHVDLGNRTPRKLNQFETSGSGKQSVGIYGWLM